MIGSLPLKSATVPEYSSLSVIIGKSVSVSNKNNFKKIMCKNTNRQKRLSNCVGDHRDTRLVPIFQSQEYSYLHWFDIHGTLDETSLYRKLKADLAMAWQEFVHNFDTLPVKLISKIRFFIDLSVTSCNWNLPHLCPWPRTFLRHLQGNTKPISVVPTGRIYLNCKSCS